MAGAVAPAGEGPRRAERAEIALPPPPVSSRYTDWTFGELPELMELRRSGQTLLGFPALLDRETHVEIEVFDEPDLAAARPCSGRAA